MTPAAAPTSAPHRRGGGTRTPTTSRGAPERLTLAKDPEKLSTTNPSTEPTAPTMSSRRADLLAQAAAVQARHRDFTHAARGILDDQPSAGTVRAAARRMTAAIHTIAEEIAEARPC